MLRLEKNPAIVGILILLCSLSMCLAEAVDVSADDFSLAFIDTTSSGEDDETDFSDELNDVFGYLGEIDTAGWCNSKINATRFDYRSFTDTIRIVLNDPVQGKIFYHPFSNYVTSPFGPRRAYWHFGVDVKVQKGDSIRCAMDGIVRVIQNDRYGYGKVVVVRHHDGLETLYAHLSKVLPEINQQVKAGEIIGLGGNTGRSTGSHLHFEMRYRGEPFDPTCVMDFGTYSLKSDTLVITQSNFDYLTELRKTVYHTVRRGETLGKIAARHGTTVRKLCALNGFSTRTVLRVGRRIIIRRDPRPEPQVTQRLADSRSEVSL